MSNIELIKEERATKIGAFLVGRLLPFREKRSVGPFVFIDHMGPVSMSEDQNLDVLPHPHIGLSTLTYLFEGTIMHRDSIGTEVEIQAGDVNWMTAGKGIVHSERTPERFRNQAKELHGLQIWVALPKDLEESDPSFHQIKSNQLPSWTDGALKMKLIAGQLQNKKSPVPVHSSLYFIEIKSEENEQVSIGEQLYGESALYILEGKVRAEGNEYEAKQILIAKNAKLCSFEMEKNTTIYIFGGRPFEEERYIDWNFVSSSKERILKAKEEWKQQQFPKINGEDEFVPYPS